MIVAAITSTQSIMWEVALGLGLVVVLVVIAVLSLLRGLVRDIDDGVDLLWMTTKLLAQNTTGLYQFAGTASIALALRDELVRHDKMLSR
ncbi:MAG: hypothetical protein M3071_11935 [Actinomycetota bacterium]|nr:hypothetical protein [Actinomycetota bacterium]